jgi:hypothetical protein
MWVTDQLATWAPLLVLAGLLGVGGGSAYAWINRATLARSLAAWRAAGQSGVRDAGTSAYDRLQLRNPGVDEERGEDDGTPAAQSPADLPLLLQHHSEQRGARGS